MRLSYRAKEVKHSVLAAFARVRYGHDASAFWSTDDWLTDHLGRILHQHASEGSGWPGGQWTPESWQDALNKAGDALQQYHDHHYLVDSEEEARLTKNAQEAIHWVADNLPSLWD